jgi:hypothetical protein
LGSTVKASPPATVQVLVLCLWQVWQELGSPVVQGIPAEHEHVAVNIAGFGAGGDFGHMATDAVGKRMNGVGLIVVNLHMAG